MALSILFSQRSETNSRIDNTEMHFLLCSILFVIYVSVSTYLTCVCGLECDFDFICLSNPASVCNPKGGKWQTECRYY